MSIQHTHFKYTQDPLNCSWISRLLVEHVEQRWTLIPASVFSCCRKTRHFVSKRRSVQSVSVLAFSTPSPCSSSECSSSEGSSSSSFSRPNAASSNTTSSHTFATSFGLQWKDTNIYSQNISSYSWKYPITTYSLYLNSCTVTYLLYAYNVHSWFMCGWNGICKCPL